MNVWSEVNMNNVNKIFLRQETVFLFVNFIHQSGKRRSRIDNLGNIVVQKEAEAAKKIILVIPGTYLN